MIDLLRAAGITHWMKITSMAKAEAHGIPLAAGLAQRSLGRIARAEGDLSRSEEHLSRALESFLAGGAELEAAMTRLDLARALVDRGEPEEARAQLAHTISVFTMAGARGRVGQAQALALELGIAESQARQ